MNKADLEPYALFTTDGNDVWRLQQYCLEPTCELLNLETGERRHFGLGGLTAQDFTRIQMPQGIVQQDWRIPPFKSRRPDEAA